MPIDQVDGPTPEQMGLPDQNNLAKEISQRASTASEKIQQRVNQEIIPGINQMGSYAKRRLEGLRNDFYTLVENPDDEVSGGDYKGWTANEIRELYSVLFGEKME